MGWDKNYQTRCSMSSNSSQARYDDFGELLWKEPPRPKRASKKFTYSNAFKLLGEALI